MKCPACSRDVTKLSVGGLCPHADCKAPLKKIKVNQDDGTEEIRLSFRKYVDSSNTTNEVENYKLVYDYNGVRIEKMSNKGRGAKKPDKYIVTYYSVKNFSWIYCPGCESKMFQNNMTRGSQEHKCKKCKSIVTYVFN